MTIEITSRQDLNPLFNPRSVALVGATQLPRFGGQVYANILGFGYAGRVYAINPRYPTLLDRPCYPSVRDLPERPDLAILALPNNRLESALQEVGDLGIPAAVIFASTYSEEGQPSLQTRLTEIACAHQIKLCGPNCMGFMAFKQRLIVSGYEVSAGVPSGNIAFVSHSGTAFDSLWQNTRGLTFNYLISSGNEIVTTVADYLQYALTDSTTHAIGLFLETVRDPATFRLALQQAAENEVPVVALKVGRSQRGAQLAQTHSGALTGDDAVYDALFDYYGVQRVRNLDEMLDILELFAAKLRPPSRYIASIHDSGGERGLLVDLADSVGVQFAPLDSETASKLAAVLEPGLAPVNPLDAWGTGNDFGAIYLNSMLALDSNPATGLNVWVCDLYPAGNITDTYVEAAINHHSQFTKPLIFLSNIAAVISAAHASKLRDAGIPLLLGTENGLRAIKHLLDYSEFQRQRKVTIANPPVRNVESESIRNTLQSAGGPLDEHASKSILRIFGLLTPPELVVTTGADALKAAEEFDYPVVLKTAMGELHKSDKGGVVLNINDSDVLLTAYAQLETAFGPRILIQKMIPPGVEIILGLSNDPQFGCVLTLGLGGIFVEIFRDVRRLMLPTSRSKVEAALLSLKSAPLLLGARGRPAINVDAIIQAALALDNFAAECGDLIASVDVNPLIASPESAIAVDALIVPKSTSSIRH